MKLFIALPAALLFLCLLTTTHAQHTDFFPDSIRVEFPQKKALVIFEMKRYQKDTQFISTFPELSQWLLEYIVKASPADGKEKPKHIIVRLKPESEKLIIRAGGAGSAFKREGEKAEITIEEPTTKTNLLVRQNTIEELLPPGWEVTIHAQDVIVHIYATAFEGLEALSKQDFNSVVTTLNSDKGMEGIGKKRIEARFIFQDDKISQQVIEFIHPGDMLSLDIQAGVGLYRERFYPELTFVAGLHFNDRFSRTNQRIKASFSSMFFTEKQAEGGYETNVNSFVSLSYGRNFSRSDRPKWTSLGVGYLVHKRGDYFEGKTMKFFFESDIGSSKLNLVPEFYLTDDFKKFQYGLKLTYTF